MKQKSLTDFFGGGSRSSEDENNSPRPHFNNNLNKTDNTDLACAKSKKKGNLLTIGIPHSFVEI